MQQGKKAVFFFCVEALDPVSGSVFKATNELFPCEKADFDVDGYPVLSYTDSDGNVFYYVRTRKVLSHDYTNYIPMMNRHFADCDVAGIVTWHAGENAPNAIFTVHTTGDVDTGCFGAANPEYMRNLLLCLEKNRTDAQLDGFQVTTEATHWSGKVYQGGAPELITQFPVPMLDIEIGSSSGCWTNQSAINVLARSLPGMFTNDRRILRNLLCAGGVHFEPAFSSVVCQTWGNFAFGVSHILANQWLITGRYEEEGQEKLDACVQSIRGGVQAIVFHDNLKGPYKDQLRVIAAKYGVPVLKHQWLRRPEDIPWNVG